LSFCVAICAGVYHNFGQNLTSLISVSGKLRDEGLADCLFHIEHFINVTGRRYISKKYYEQYDLCIIEVIQPPNTFRTRRQEIQSRTYV
jgi:hypothetical protein